jgi:hypothetical protein
VKRFIDQIQGINRKNKDQIQGINRKNKRKLCDLLPARTAMRTSKSSFGVSVFSFASL